MLNKLIELFEKIFIVTTCLHAIVDLVVDALDVLLTEDSQESQVTEEELLEEQP